MRACLIVVVLLGTLAAQAATPQKMAFARVFPKAGVEAPCPSRSDAGSAFR
jgi:hypothetical protein